MLKYNSCNEKPKEQQYLQNIDMTVSDSTLGYTTEGHYSTNPIIRWRTIYSKNVIRNTKYKEINEGSTRKKI